MNSSTAGEPPATADKNLFHSLEFKNILKCVHCGLCLDSCPTYRELDDEKDSPRGRLYLMRGLWEGELQLTREVAAPLGRCLDCRACESACPSGVPYGELLEKSRGVILETRRKSIKEWLARTMLLKGMFRSSTALAAVSQLIRLYRVTGIPWLLTQSPLSRIIPRKIVFSQHLMPEFSGRSFKRRYADQALPSLRPGETSGRVGLFTGCIMDVSETDIHESSIRLLRSAGYEVIVPGNQGCCGALHVHSGERNTARFLAVRNINAFAPRKLDAIITNAAGCGAQLKEYHLLFTADNPDAELDWRGFENRTFDLLEFIARDNSVPASMSWQEESEVVLYDAPCHLLHAQKVDANPRRLIGSLPGIRLVPLPDSSWCCGSAGVYNLVHAELAGSILKRKIASIRETLERHPEAKILLTANPGCLYQIRAGIRSEGLPLQVMHPAVFLAGRLA